MKHRGVIVTPLVTWSSNCGHVTYVKVCAIWYHLYNLKSVKNTLLKVKLLQGCFSRFLSCTNGTKSGKALHIFPRIILRTGYQKNAYPNPELEFFHTHLKCIVRKAKTNTWKKGGCNHIPEKSRNYLLSINSEYDENQGHSKIRFLKYNNNITLLLKAKLWALSQIMKIHIIRKYCKTPVPNKRFIQITASCHQTDNL